MKSIISKAFAMSSLVALFFTFVSSQAFAANYHVNPAGCTIARGIDNYSVEVDVNCGGTLNVVVYYMASNSTNTGYILDATATALITTPASSFTDFNMNCTATPPTYNGNETVYSNGPTGSVQNCTLFVNTSN